MWLVQRTPRHSPRDELDGEECDANVQRGKGKKTCSGDYQVFAKKKKKVPPELRISHTFGESPTTYCSRSSRARSTMSTAASWHTRTL